MLAMELRESKVWALLSVRGMQSIPAAAAKQQRMLSRHAMSVGCFHTHV